ncbi:hypothetical protein [Evansella clarkii]|uniref:hypothetical protein n=1 Tax=Evansella clarkii TaxID=79879 RepID=UPI0009966728|nr:hypothetical protein [Evansella clarkii]
MSAQMGKDIRVKQEFNKWKKFFEVIDGCNLVNMGLADGRYKIAALIKVPWHEHLKAQYNEHPDKIGYLYPQSSGMRLDIDFPSQSVTKEEVQSIIDPQQRIPYFPPGQKAPGRKSWWRFRSEAYDTVTIVIREDTSGMIDLSSPEVELLFKRMINYARL